MQLQFADTAQSDPARASLDRCAKSPARSESERGDEASTRRKAEAGDMPAGARRTRQDARCGQTLPDPATGSGHQTGSDALLKQAKADQDLLRLWRQAVTRRKGRPSENADDVRIKPQHGNSVAYLLTELQEQKSPAEAGRVSFTNTGERSPRGPIKQLASDSPSSHSSRRAVAAISSAGDRQCPERRDRRSGSR